MVGKVFGNRLSTRTSRPHTRKQRTHATHEQPRLERPGDTADLRADTTNALPRLGVSRGGQHTGHHVGVAV